jgi:predicted metal-dependent phosphoesterase TrpH
VGFADLHMHSRWSDGEWRPAKLVREAAVAGLGAISLTDHDETGGFPEAQEAGREHGIVVLPGVELSTWDGTDRHLLGYGFDPENGPLAELTRTAREDRLRRAERIVERLAELGRPVPLESVLAEAAGAAVGRPHVARAMVKAGQVKTFREAFDEYLGDGKPACVEKRRLVPGDAIRAVQAAGGVAVIAHPGMNGGPEELDPLVELGLDGVEVRHPNHGEKSEAAFDDFALRHDLVRTGGSDFHGPRWGGLGVGTVSIPREWWEALLERVNARRAAAGLAALGA